MPKDLDRGLIEQALTAVGELLAAEGEQAAVVITGGATLSLLGVVARTTSDVDVIARAYRDEKGTLRLLEPEPFPPPLAGAIRAVARDLGLDEYWMNAQVGTQWAQGLPPWTAEALEWKNYGGGLDVGLVGRRTLIALKLFASADQDPRSVHFQDLLQLGPTDGELEEVRGWVLTQDTSPQWPAIVDEVIDHARRSR